MVLLGTATWLFIRDASSPDPKPPASSAADPKGAQAEGVLSVPDEQDLADERRRGAAGRDRLDPADSTTTAPGADADAADPSLPASFAGLKGASVALAPAAGLVSSDGAPLKVSSIGGIDVSCGSSDDGEERIERLARERAALDRVAKVLERAGANVTRIDAAKGRVECIPARVRAMEEADFALVVRADPGGDTLAYAARPATSLDKASAAASTALAAELAGALSLGQVSIARSSDERAMLADAGAIDLPAGASSALVQLGGDTPTAAQLDATALDLARAIAATAARADGPTSR